MLSKRAQGRTTRGSSTLGKDYPESALGQDYFEISYFCPRTKKYSGLFWYVNNRCEKPDGVCPGRIQVTAVSLRKKGFFLAVKSSKLPHLVEMCYYILKSTLTITFSSLVELYSKLSFKLSVTT